MLPGAAVSSRKCAGISRKKICLFIASDMKNTSRDIDKRHRSRIEKKKKRAC